uniref:Transmembrane protein n=1 Tax=Zonotrichia albicollis TaxID=44394 RepID=A0A8D2M6T4_ZONAL
MSHPLSVTSLSTTFSPCGRQQFATGSSDLVDFLLFIFPFSFFLVSGLDLIPSLLCGHAKYLYAVLNRSRITDKGLSLCGGTSHPLK